MKNTNLDNVHPACKDFVLVVENLLSKRQKQIHEGNYSNTFWHNSDWGLRVFTRTELEYMVYSSYKQMRNGRITRPPRRETVMEIAGYLNCNIEERNRLLVAADLSPITPYPNDQELSNILQVIIEITKNLELPAMVVNRDWHIYYFNQQLIRLYDVTAEQLMSIKPHQMNVLQLLFDPHLPLYPRLIQNKASWTRMVRQTIFGFKSANTLYQFEEWYQTLVSQLMELPDFKYHWEAVSSDTVMSEPGGFFQEEPVTVDTVITSSQHPPQRAWIRPLLISAGYFQFDFPQIIAFLPADYQSKKVFKNIGLLVA